MLEYASIVWDGCSKQDAEKLEKVQLTTMSQNLFLILLNDSIKYVQNKKKTKKQTNNPPPRN